MALSFLSGRPGRQSYGQLKEQTWSNNAIANCNTWAWCLHTRSAISGRMSREETLPLVPNDMQRPDVQKNIDFGSSIKESLGYRKILYLEPGKLHNVARYSCYGVFNPCAFFGIRSG